MAELSPASAGDAVARLLAAAGPILSLDIGSGTQDVLLPMSRLRIGPAAASRRATASPADAGESSAMTIFLYSG